MIIRLAEQGDATGIAAVLNPVIRNTTISFKSEELTLDQVRDMIAAAPVMFVAEENGAILGYASYSQFRRGMGYDRTMEHAISLSPDARGRGVGRQLMNTIEIHARKAGMGSLWAGISGENPGAVEFHKAIGFEQVAILPDVGFKFGRWIDLILMRKWLSPAGDDGRGTD